MKRPVLIFVRTGNDWEGLYKDGQLVAEDHNIEYDVVLKHLGVLDKVEEMWIDGTSKEAKLNDVGRLPQTLDELREW